MFKVVGKIVAVTKKIETGLKLVLCLKAAINAFNEEAVKQGLYVEESSNGSDSKI